MFMVYGFIPVVLPQLRAQVVRVPRAGHGPAKSYEFSPNLTGLCGSMLHPFVPMCISEMALNINSVEVVWPLWATIPQDFTIWQWQYADLASDMVI